MNLRAAWQRLHGAKYRYVLVTTLVSLLAFARNLLFMKTLDLAALGQIVIMQTLIMLVGFVQVGLINGAYIQYAARDRARNRQIVDVMSTAAMLLLPIAMLISLGMAATGFASDLIRPATLAFGLTAGIATLASTWLNNALVADGLLVKSNLANLGAVLLSLTAAFLSRRYGLNAALASVLLQPLTVVVVALIVDPNLRPSGFSLHSETLGSLFRLGAMPFLGGLAVLGMYQVERWTIAAVLGPEALGEFYIVLMYATFFTLIPAALLNFFFPQAKRAFAGENGTELRILLRRHLIDLLSYFVLAVLCTLALMQVAVDRFLPEFSQCARLVYVALPGLIIFGIRDTASLVLFASGKMQPLVSAGVLTLVLFSIFLAVLYGVNDLSLISVLAARAVAMLPGTLILLVEKRRQVAEMGNR
ncbi:MAG: hypothetical protein ABI459_05755 [Deltaproteobacteria bacterium]